MKQDALDEMWSTAGAAFLAMAMGALWVWPKFFGVEVHPIFGWAEALTGAGWLEPGLRYAVGAAAAVIVVLLLVPKTRLAGAWSALALSLLFIAAHLTPWLGVNIPNYGPLMEALEAGRNAEQIQAMGLKGDRGAHLTLALVNAGLAAITLGAEYKMRRPKPPTVRQVLAMA